MNRRLRLLGELVDGGAEVDPRRVCEVSTRVTGTNGAGIMLMTDDQPWGSICTTDTCSALIEDLQFSLGEGPCIDAHIGGGPILEPDLAEPERRRWTAFAGSVLDAGGRAVFAYPLRIGEVRLGALDLYRSEPGPLSPDQHADALVLADIATRTLLLMQADAPPGQIAASLEQEAEFQWIVHQASGMVAAQLEVSVGQAMVRLRAYAFGSARALRDVADDVVERRLRFSEPAARAEDLDGVDE